MAVGRRPILATQASAGLLEYPHSGAAGFLKPVSPEGMRRKPHVFNDLVSAITVTFAVFYPLEARSLIQSNSKEERGIQLHLLKQRVIKKM